MTEDVGVAGPERENAAKALQDVTATPSCAGCGRSFTPKRRGQRHCRVSCRVAALRARRAAGGDVYAPTVNLAALERRVLLRELSIVARRSRASPGRCRHSMKEEKADESIR